MRRHPLRLFGPVLAGLIALLVAGRFAAQFYTEILWFGNVGYATTFWSRVWADVSVRIAAILLGGGIVFLHLWLVARKLGPVHVRRRYGNLEISEQIPRRQVMIGITLAALLTGLWLADVKFGGGQSLSLLAFTRRTAWGIVDPLFGRDLSYYVFALPVYLQLVDFLLLVTAWSLFLCVLGYALVGTIRMQANKLEIDDRPRLHLAILAACMITLLGIRYWLNRYGVLFNGTGFGGGVGYTDVHARLPAQRALALLSILSAATVIYGALRRSWLPAVGSSLLLALAAVVLGFLYPSAIQKFRVEPNQLGREGEYIGWNMEYTRRAYGLDSLDRRAFHYRRGVPPGIDALGQVPIWDPEPLLTVFNELQATYGYYHFSDVDLDRYPSANGPQQVAIGVREFLPQGLQENARTWQTLHLNPSNLRGQGAVIAPVTEKDEGKPRYWLHRVPLERTPEAPASVALTEPSVYFGETMDEYAILNTVLDTTSANAVRPRGIGLGSFLRMLAFASRFSEKNLLLSGQLTDSSSILFRRRLDDRLRALAPFILWDRNPQPVVTNGRIVWVVDGYTATANFPIARPLRVDGAGEVRYLRNSVKATVDAVTGETLLYALREDEPMLATYRTTFPDLFKPAAQMPADIVAHLRYPAFYLSAQADILEEYHLNQPEAFFAGQDVWRLRRGTGAEAAAQPFRPLYTSLVVDAGSAPEFVAAAPFMGQRRRNLTALLLVRNDAPNYGRMVVLEVARDQQVAGPEQVEALVEQDPLISPQLTLWRQAGSDVNIGEVRIVPIDSTFLYLLPVFLAAQGSPIPELQRIIVSDGDRVVMAPSSAEAIAMLRGSGVPSAPASATSSTTAPAIQRGVSGDWSRRALELLEAAEAALRNGDWAGYGARQRELRELLLQAARQRVNQP